MAELGWLRPLEVTALLVVVEALRLGVAVLDPVAHLPYHSIQSASAGGPRGALVILVIQYFHVQTM